MKTAQIQFRGLEWHVIYDVPVTGSGCKLIGIYQPSLDNFIEFNKLTFSVKIVASKAAELDKRYKNEQFREFIKQINHELAQIQAELDAM